MRGILHGRTDKTWEAATLGAMVSAQQHAADLAAFVQAAPSSYHAAAEVGRRLKAAGHVELDETQSWSADADKAFVIRDGAVVAWRLPERSGPTTPVRILGSHTDSPTFRLKPRPDLDGYGYQQLGMEVYGGPLLNSWLDRELGLAGRLFADDGPVPVRTGPLLRIPQLAIHLDRSVSEAGLTLDKQAHLMPVWSVGSPGLQILDYLADQVGYDAEEILGFDVLAFDTAAPAIFGPSGEFFASARLDNLSSVHASVTALIGAPPSDSIAMLAAFDHEELGSASRSGASGPFLETVLSRLGTMLGAGPDQRHRALAASACLSSDAGHAIHPNYPGRHDPANRPVLNGGPLIKVNANQRYATDGWGEATWRRACRAAQVTTQAFVSNNALPCGSTIGPLTATRLGIRTVDVGIPTLSMHSARELTGVEDPAALARAMEAFLGIDL